MLHSTIMAARVVCTVVTAAALVVVTQSYPASGLTYSGNKQPVV
jgi:hypothetical protein